MLIRGTDITMIIIIILLHTALSVRLCYAYAASIRFSFRVHIIQIMVSVMILQQNVTILRNSLGDRLTVSLTLTHTLFFLSFNVILFEEPIFSFSTIFVFFFFIFMIRIKKRIPNEPIEGHPAICNDSIIHPRDKYGESNRQMLPHLIFIESH